MDKNNRETKAKSFNRTKSIIILFAFVLSLLLLSSCSFRKAEPNNSDYDLPQYSKLYEYDGNYNNNGIYDYSNNNLQYKFNYDEKVDVIIELESASLYDNFLNQTLYSNFTDYITCDIAKSQKDEILELQDLVKSEIKEEDIEIEFGHSYTILQNAFSGCISYGDIDLLEKIDSVKNVIVSEKYDNPSSVNIEDNLKSLLKNTGICENTSQYQGEGMLIAVIDSGVDYTLSTFQTLLNEDEINLNKEQLAQLIPNIYGNANFVRFTENDIYVNSKIPFQFCYADMEANAVPNLKCVQNNDGYHGTHVAGIIAGDDDVIKGVLPKAQIAAMKVASNKTYGIKTTDILAALDDCVVLGVDALNMSLGAPAGFTAERYQDSLYINDIYNKLEKLGIVLCISAGNSFSMGRANVNGYSSSENPDNGTICSPGSYTATLSIGSINAYSNDGIFNINGMKILYKEANNGTNYYKFNEILNEKEAEKYNLCLVPGFGQEKDYEGIDVSGKLVLIKRGEISFSEKVKNAADKGAIGCIFYNNIDGLISPSVPNPTIPVCSIKLEAADKIINSMENNNAVVELNIDNEIYFMSEFSSWGTVGDLKINPDVTSFGGNIYSSVPLTYENTGYAYMSGTSMAAPNLTGIISALLQKIKNEHPELTSFEAKRIAIRTVMSTATIARTYDGSYALIRQQGAGVANLEAALNTPAYLSVSGNEKTKVELGADINKDGIYTIKFNLVNTSENALTYDISNLTMIEKSENGLLKETSSIINPSMQIKCKNAVLEGTIITVEANSTANISVQLVISESDKEYMNATYINGNYIEGFIRLYSEDLPELSIPFLGFYGDFSKASALDNCLYEDSYYVYPTTLLGSVGEYDGRYDTWNPVGMVLGQYAYANLPDGYERPEGSADKIVLINDKNVGPRIYGSYTSLLRNAAELHYRIIDANSGLEYFHQYGYNLRKAYFNPGINAPAVNAHMFNVDARDLKLANNQELLFVYDVVLDCDGNYKNQRVEIPFFVDYEAPTVDSFEIINEDGKTYISLNVYDNHYLMDYQIGTISSTNKIFINSLPIPVYSFNKHEINTLEIDITNYLQTLKNNKIVIVLEDYALNSKCIVIDMAAAEDNSTNEFNNSENINNFDNIISYEFSNYDEFISNNIGIEPNEASSPETEFVVENGILTEYNGNSEIVTIPGDLGIKELGEFVFYQKNSMRQLIIPEGVETIGRYSISCNKNLVKIELPKSLKTVGKYGIYANLSLKELNLEDTAVNTYEYYSVYYNTALEYLELPAVPDSNVIMGNFAFGALTSLKKLVVNCDIELTNTSFDALISLETIEFKGNVTITKRNICGSHKLKSIVFYKNANIGNYSFSGCSALETIEVFGELTANSGSFSNLPKLQNIILHSGLNVDYSAFGSINIDTFTVAEDNNELCFDESTGVTYNKDKTKMYLLPKWTCNGTFTIPDSVTELSDYLFAYYDSYYMCSFMFTYMEMGLPYYMTTTTATEGSSIETKKGIKEIIFGKGCKNIPEGLCVNLADLKSIAFSENTETIGDYSFNNTGLEKVIIPDNIISTGIGSFSSCKNIKYVEFGKGLTEISSKLFESSFTLYNIDITVPDNILKISDRAFFGCESLWNINLSETTNLTEIGDFAFAGCSIKSFKLPETLTKLGSGVFGSCILFEKLELNEKLNYLPSKLFMDCSSLKEFIIPDYITSLGDDLFKNCIALEKVTLPKTLTTVPNGLFNNCQSLKSIELPDGITTIGKNAFTNCIEIENLEIQATVTSIGNNAFDGCKKIKEFIIPDSVTTIGTYAFANCDSITSFNLPEKFKKIPNGLFSGCDNLVSVTFSADVNNIGSYAFSDCISLVDVSIPSKVTTIGSYAFRNCHKANNLTIPSGLKAFSYYVFENCYLLKDFEFPANVSSISTGAFKGCTGLTKVIMNNKVRSLSNFAFQDCINLKEIKLSTALTSIGTSTFENCESLESIEIPSNVTKIGDYAFRNTGIKNAHIASKITTINISNVYRDCKQLENITIDAAHLNYCDVDGVVYSKDMSSLVYYPAGKTEQSFKLPDTVKAIDEYAFYAAQNLVEVDTNNVEIIWEYAFANTILNKVVVNESLKELDNYSFANTKNLQQFDFDYIQYIGYGAFMGSGLSSVIISDSINAIQYFAFAECDNLTDVYFNENALLIYYHYVFLDSDNITGIHIEENSLNYNMDNGILYNKDKTYLIKAFETEKDLVIENTVVKIEAYAFYNNKVLETVEFPTSLKAIGHMAFYGCESLKELTFKSETAPRLEGLSDEINGIYANFVIGINQAPLNIKINTPDNNSYRIPVWVKYFGLN